MMVPLLIGFAALHDGLALTPPMGFNPWNCFGISAKGTCKLPLPWKPSPGPRCHSFDESVILEVAQAIAASPLKAAGYEYINLDCGYSTGFRDGGGALVVNRTKYPHGMRWLVEQIHDLGLKFGIYSDAGKTQCCSRLYSGADDGSAGREAQDARTFASWGVDFVKHDSCGEERPSYSAMRDALNATGRPMVYSIHSPYDMAGRPDLAHMWRTTGDIDSTFSSILSRALLNNQTAAIAGPGGWNDPDMLEIGNLFGEHGDAEGRTQMSLWCLMKAPLLIGTDVTNMTKATLSTLTNHRALAVLRDQLGVQGTLRRADNSSQIWAGPLVERRFVAALVNNGSAPRNVTLYPSDLESGLDSGAAWMSAAGHWEVVDAWGDVSTVTTLPLTRTIEPHGTALLLLTPKSLSVSDRGFGCWGAISGLLWSSDPYHNTDCEHLNAKAGSGWVCNGQVWPPTREEGERWVAELNSTIKGAAFYLYSDRTPFYYLASHTCAADSVKLTNWIYNASTRASPRISPRVSPPAALPTLGDAASRDVGDNYTLVVVWTQPDGDGVWATDAAVDLVNAGIFDDPSAAQLSLVGYGDAYVNNSFSCGSGGWNTAGAACWLSNCSKPWPPTKAMAHGECYGYPSPGSSICKHGVRECNLLRWQGFIWLHYLTLPTLATAYYACLQAGAANSSLVTADAIAERCAAKSHVSQSMYEHLRDHYVHTWRGEETLAGNAMIQSWHLRRADATHGPTWPIIQIGDGDSPPSTYIGSHSTEGLMSAICKSIAATAGAAKLPRACSKVV